jgi:hypothetical protein
MAARQVIAGALGAVALACAGAENGVSPKRALSEIAGDAGASSSMSAGLGQAAADAIAAALKEAVDQRAFEDWERPRVTIHAPKATRDADGAWRIGLWSLEEDDGHGLEARITTFVSDAARLGFVAVVTNDGGQWQVGELRRVTVHGRRSPEPR